MTADKRTVTTDALETLGSIISENEKRDAIHLAVEPVIAGQRLHPGDHVGLDDEGRAMRRGVKLLGIVDPFLDVNLQEGDRFWLIVYPRQITSLRHVWEHPDFPASGETDVKAPATDKSASEKWLWDFIARSDCPDYDTVIAAALNNSDTWDSDYLHFQDRDAHGNIPPEFWTHVEIVTGQKIPTKDRAKYFSCSC